MKKLFAFWKRIPRQARAIIYFSCILLCIAIILVLSKIPSYTAEMQYRRLEKQHMIGPAKILGTETLPNGSTKLLVAQSDTELMLYRYWVDDYTNYNSTYNSTDLVCRKKNGKLTILAAGGNHPSYSHYNSFTLPIILFDEYPAAVRAEVEFDLFFGDYTDPQWTIPYEKHFNLEATRTNEGYFCFLIQYKAYTNVKYSAMLNDLASISAGNYTNSNVIKYTPIPVTVHLYDKNNQLIVDQIIYFQHPGQDLLQK